MSTEAQTQESPVDMLPVTFQAQGRVRLVRVPADRAFGSRMQRQKIEGLAYEFVAPESRSRFGELIVDEDLIQRDREFFEKYDPTFPKDGSGDPMTLQWLRNHEYMGNRIWEIPPTPPDPSETLTQITTAAARGDVDALAKLYEREDATFKRAVILEPIETALNAIEEARAAQEQPAEPSAAVGTAPDHPPTFRPPEQE